MKRLIFPLVILGVIFGLVPNRAFAEDQKTVSSIGISPATQEIELNPGDTYEGKFIIVNPDKATELLNFEIDIVPYGVSNENYDADFEEKSDSTQIVNWITLSDSTGIIEPGKSQEIMYFIDVPGDAPAGGQYAAFIIRSVNPESSTDNSRGVAVSATTQIASIIYASVAGETYAEGLILENSIPIAIFNSPLTASALLKNVGNVHLRFQQIIEVFPLFSDEPIYTNEENPKTTVIMPNTNLFTETIWNESPALGIFKVHQTITFGSETSEQEGIIFLCPTWFLIAVIIFFATCASWIIYRVYIRRQIAKRAKPGANFQAN